jgi:hypothetical protein
MRSPIRPREGDDDPSAQGLSKILHKLQNNGPIGRNVVSGPTFSGDRAALELQRKLSLTPTGVPEPLGGPYEESARRRSSVLFWRLFSLFAVIAAIVAWGFMLFPSFTKTVWNGQQIDAVHGKGALLVAAASKPVSTVGDSRTTEVGIQTGLAAAKQSQPRIVGLVPISDPIVTAAPPKPTDLAPATKTVPVPAVPAAMASPTPTTISPLSGSPAPPPAPVMADANPATSNSNIPPSSQPVPLSASATPAEQRPASSQNSAVLDNAEIAMLINRGRSFLSVGDISSAQLLFRRAAEAGSAEAALSLASTYDPHYLTEHHVIGVAGDEEKARLWYQRARDLGSPEADHLLAQLSPR